MTGHLLLNILTNSCQPPDHLTLTCPPPDPHLSSRDTAVSVALALLGSAAPPLVTPQAAPWLPREAAPLHALLGALGPAPLGSNNSGKKNKASNPPDLVPAIVKV